MAIDLSRALTFATRDPDWRRKCLIGAALSAIPLVNLVTVTGYATGLLRNVHRGARDSEVLPGWDNPGELLFKGLMAFGVMFCYGALFGTLNLVVAMPAGLAAAGLHQGGLPVPTGVVLGVLSALFFLCGSLVGLAALTLYAEDENFGDAFQPGEIFARLAAAPRDWAVIVGVFAGSALVISWMTSWVPLVGMLLAGALMFPVVLVSFHALGQLMAGIAPPVVLERRTPAPPPKTGGSRPASAYADGKHETVLTWSTDSDRPDED